MYTNEFEEAFAAFLEQREYDRAEDFLFSLARAAFAAGWMAAGGTPPKAKKIFQLIPGKNTNGPK